ncbi:uncharacterized protein LOC127985606 [Carassius gibelio]|uniref:uncharacterized protein LOC127985606 n=1 Tax=Carassius gibelio TaxID=101364 RepID=UPI00227831A0|nr:uncharacterized protein LOC127985606 [Carassius gibelio]
MSKILNLNENEADQLADFLGHDIRIHRQYYRLPEGTLQLAKMSKVLMAMEKGTLSDYKGKKLDDIEIDPNEQLEAQGDSMSSDEEDSSDLSQTPAPVQTDQPVQSEQAVSQEDQGSSNAPKKKWEDSEVKAVERHMMSFIKTCKVPGKQECIHAEPEALKQRTWTDSDARDCAIRQQSTTRVIGEQEDSDRADSLERLTSSDDDTANPRLAEYTA